MLLGQQFRRRHHHRLISRFHRLQYRGGGDQCLAGTHVPLHQPLHGMRSGQVGVDLADHPALRAGQLEGQLTY